VAVEEQANKGIEIPSILHDEDLRNFELWVFASTMMMTQHPRMFHLQLRIRMDARARNGILFHIVIAVFVERAMSSQY
jgi:anaerobic selenocysteine-containing dehydrogenase